MIIRLLHKTVFFFSFFFSALLFGGILFIGKKIVLIFIGIVINLHVLQIVGLINRVFVFVLWVFADLLHILSFLPKELNFVNHTSYIGWRE